MFVIFDLDGTLSDTGHRAHYVARPKGQKDWDSFHAAAVADPPITPVVWIYRSLVRGGHDVEIWTGRDERYVYLTRQWLARHGIFYPTLRMRPDGDHTEDTELKRGWLMESPRLPDLVFEDRARVVSMYREYGIRVAQIAEGNF